MMRILCAAACLGLVAAVARAEAGEKKYLIEFGWDEPTAAFMKAHVAEMERTPFDGTVFHIQYTNPDGTAGSFMNECWGTRAFTDRELKAAEEDLKTTRFTTFTQNFLRFNVLPGVLDWFDDYSAVVNNARQAARIASAGGAAGILFDVEAYNGSLWNYAKQQGNKSRSFAAYAAQAESRGAEVMRAFQEGWKAGGSARPLVVFQTFGYSLPRQQAGGDRAKLAAQEYGLLAPFMDGMYAAADDAVTIVDGFEFAYGYKDEAAFKDARELVLGKLPAFVKDKDAYLKHTSLGIGLWMDYDWRKKGWDEKDASKNYFKPADFERSVTLGLKYADRYVWVYTEKPKWWTPAGDGPTGVASAYIDAVHQAKEGQ